MTNKLRLIRQIAALAFCVCVAHNVHYAQTQKPESLREVVRLRSKIELQNPRQVVFSPVSKLLAVQRKDGSVQIIDLTNGREQSVLPLSEKALYAMQWTTDGQRLLVVDSKSAAVWDARRGTRLSALIEIKRSKYFLGIDQVVLSPDEKLFLSVKTRDSLIAGLLEKDNARAQVWDLESGRMKCEIKIDGDEGRAQFSPDSKLLLTTSATADPRLWEVETGRLFAALRPPVQVLGGGAAAEFSPDGKFVVGQHYWYGIWIWDRSTGVSQRGVPAHKNDTAKGVQGFTPDGKMFAVVRQGLKGWSRVTSIELRDCETGELRTTLTADKWEEWPQYTHWGNGGRTFVATSGRKYKGRVWDVSTGRLTATIPLLLTNSRIPFDFGFKDRDELAVHPTLPIISATSNKLVRLWNAETGELMQTLENTGEIGQWSADGKLFVTAGKDYAWVSVWDVTGPELVSHAKAEQTSWIPTVRRWGHPSADNPAFQLS